MFFRNQTTFNHQQITRFSVYNISVLVIVLLLGFFANLANADSAQTSTNVSPAKIGFKYQEIKAIAKKLNNQSAPEELENLVEKSTYFIASFPEYKRIDEVYYRLGNALFRLERVEESIKVFEELDKKDPDARWVAPSLLELGLAYDKLGKHDKADESYNKLINHPKYGKRSYAQHAKKILEQDIASRKGELPKPPGASSTPVSELIGKPAPDFQVKDLKGEELTLEKFRGQVVLLDFWATWCGPCLTEMPKVKKTYEKYKDQKFQIIGISRDNSKTPLEAYVEKEGLAWINYWDENGKLTDLYKVIGFPTTFLIDGAGVIRKASLGGSDVETAVAELVKENLAKPSLPEKTTSDSPIDNQKVDAKAKEIIDAAVAAHGGLDKLAAVKNIAIETRSFEYHPDDIIDDEGTSKMYLFPNKFRGDWYANDQRFSLIFNGNSVYEINDGKITQRPPEKAKSYANAYKNKDFRELIWPLTDLLKEDITIQYEGTEKVGGMSASVLLVTQSSDKMSKVFISEKTHYVVKLSYSGDLGGKPQDVIIYLDDYRDVNGIMVPHKRTTKTFEHRETLITDIKLNTEIDETLFSPKEANE